MAYQVNSTTHAISAIASFNFNTIGAYPLGGVTFDASGNLLGTLNYGGDLTLNNGSGAGAIFKIDGSTHAVSTVANFSNSTGSFPESRLVLDSNGNLYGTTSVGGSSDLGTVFEVPAGTNNINTLVTFNGTNGAGPDGSLFIDDDGNLFGTTVTGGANSKGTIFELAAGSHAFSTLFSFNGTNGRDPYANVIEDANGNLFGTTRLGGPNDDGTVFELSPVPEPSAFVLGIGAACALAMSTLVGRRR